MAEEPESDSSTPQYVIMLDNLIRESISELKESMKGKVKLGDYLKMIEMRHKLSSGNASDQAFWKMINQLKVEIQRTPRNEPNPNDPQDQSEAQTGE
jgi:hypothetical protein